MLYEMLSGRLPFSGEREEALLYAVVHEAPKPLPIPPVPPALARIIGKALEKKPEARYGSAAELLRDLRAYREGEQVKPLVPAPHNPAAPELPQPPSQQAARRLRQSPSLPTGRSF